MQKPPVSHRGGGFCWPNAYAEIDLITRFSIVTRATDPREDPQQIRSRCRSHPAAGTPAMRLRSASPRFHRRCRRLYRAHRGRWGMRLLDLRGVGHAVWPLILFLL